MCHLKAAHKQAASIDLEVEADVEEAVDSTKTFCDYCFLMPWLPSRCFPSRSVSVSRSSVAAIAKGLLSVAHTGERLCPPPLPAAPKCVCVAERRVERFAYCQEPSLRC